MIVDANLLLYAKISSFPEHSNAKKWLDAAFQSGERLGLPWDSLTAFVRISTNPRLFERPLGISAAWHQVKQWLEAPSVWTPGPTERHTRLLETLIPYCSGAPGLIHDAHLAAIALGHGVAVYSMDGDFARFPSVRWLNPLRG